MRMGKCSTCLWCSTMSLHVHVHMCHFPPLDVLWLLFKGVQAWTDGDLKMPILNMLYFI